eukprot:TRINITY_DN1119_c0_g1_i2.p1 TRINITY_DN1119_c0_g1~~TRINITY_DN1119_c0_g1_i2.p1  ORF type:complete len:350 (-),score=111.29 TRINITY_DN1119_c0_g1_i2:58-1107(-)
MRLKTLNDVAARYGLALPNLGQISEQAFIGAASTGTHGTGITLGNLGNLILSVRLILSTGKVITISTTENAEMLGAVRVGLGALGIISTVTVQLVDAFNVERMTFPLPIDSLLSNLNSYLLNPRFQFIWIPYTNNAQVLLMNPSQDQINPRDRWWQTKEGGDGFTSALAYCQNQQNVSACNQLVITPALIPNRKDSFVDRSDYAINGPVPDSYTEMESFLPASETIPAFQALRKMIDSNNYPLNFPVTVRFVKADNIWLSPCYQTDCVVFSTCMYREPQYFDKFTKDIEALFLSLYPTSFRPLWGKVNHRRSKNLRPAFPLFDQFIALREKLDPYNTFLNDYLKERFYL